MYSSPHISNYSFCRPPWILFASTSHSCRDHSNRLNLFNYISGLKFLHILMGHEYSFTSDYVLSLVFRGVEKTLRHVPVRAQPVTPSILHAMASVVDFDNQKDISCLCAGVFMFMLMARAGNVFIRADNGLHVGLKHKHVRCEGDVILVTFKRTKTIQFGKRVLQIPIVAIPASPICPVTLYRRMVQLTPGSPPSAPLFAVMDRDLCYPMSKAWFLTRFRVLLGKAGVPNPDAFSCPSFRRGGASWAFRAGLPGELIQAHGDWASDCYKLYIDITMQSKYMFARNFTNFMLA